MSKLRIIQLRGGTVESEHPVAAVLCDARGTVVQRVGAPMVTTMRSAAKPFQLEAALGLLPPHHRSALTTIDLAMGAASHSAQMKHIDHMHKLMALLGQEEADLLCGAHAPMHQGAERALMMRVAAPTALHNNCSGKHCFMAAASAAQGWDPDYRDLEHPLQLAIRALMDNYTGGRVQTGAIDGCGVPCWVAPLAGFATAWAHVANGMQQENVLGRIGLSMAKHSWWVSGDGRIDHALVSSASAPMVSKVGAAALICQAFPEQGLGLALKVRSGDNDARAIAVSAVLKRWVPGLIAPEAVAEWRTVRNVVGKVVGERIAVWE